MDDDAQYQSIQDYARPTDLPCRAQPPGINHIASQVTAARTFGTLDCAVVAIRHPRTTSFPAGKYLFAGVVDGRNISANDLASSLSILETFEAIVGKVQYACHVVCSLPVALIDARMCYSNLNDIIHSIIDMDADVIMIENSKSDEQLLSVFREGVKYGAGISPIFS
ncbi:hypothetical protein ZIOFF_031412 [Zingiber officinale]|uniref:5-methyltetrahydropteroyltriglutamate--homocysteine S-methyltransferase n=1 Tax=Zingiber officinale TaxID=94328 RepID=A0A8J5GGJ6_ZINOF|nr:hypothetical protein ZIOFF_031412 [Zingiber officinale]